MLEQKTESRHPGAELRPPPHEQRGGLPAVIEQASPRQRRWRLGIEILALVLLISSAAGIGWSWWRHLQAQLPPGIAYSNGRLEADAIDIDTKFAGRIATLFVDEGDIVTAGQAVAMMDTRDLEASLRKSQALESQARRVLEEAKANLVLQQTQATLAQQQLDRASGYCQVEAF